MSTLAFAMDQRDSALPIIPQSVSRGARFSRLRWFATATACQVAGPPCTDLTGLPANGGFYFQAFDGSVTLPIAGYNYNSVWTPLLAGLPPAGMAASLAALVRPCFGLASKRSWQGAPKTRSTPSHQAQFWNRRDRYRYRQELVSRRGSRSAWHDRPAPEVVSRPSGNTTRQPTALSHRHGGLRRRTQSEPQTHIAWPRR